LVHLPFAMSTHPARLLGATVLALCALAACKREEAPPPKPAAVEAPAAPARTREQAMAQLMALPEVKAWSEQIEKLYCRSCSRSPSSTC
jgi:hypothetical protein